MIVGLLIVNFNPLNQSSIRGVDQSYFTTIDGEKAPAGEVEVKAVAP